MTSAPERPLLRRAAVIVASCAGAALVTVGCSKGPVTVTLPTVPSTFAVQEFTSSSLGPDYSRTALPVVERAAEVSTTTLSFAKGKVTLTGTVRGPSGAVAGAVVRIERLVGDRVAVRDVVTDEKGRYTLAGVTGGRIRLRAWRAPDLAAVSPVALFASGTTKTDLSVERFGTPRVQWALSPSPPIIGRSANLVLQVIALKVEGDGVVRPRPLSNLAVALSPLGSLVTDQVEPILTNEQGRVLFAMRCATGGPSTVRVELGGDVGERPDGGDGGGTAAGGSDETSADRGTVAVIVEPPACTEPPTVPAATTTTAGPPVASTAPAPVSTGVAAAATVAPAPVSTVRPVAVSTSTTLVLATVPPPTLTPSTTEAVVVIPPTTQP